MAAAIRPGRAILGDPRKGNGAERPPGRRREGLKKKRRKNRVIPRQEGTQGTVHTAGEANRYGKASVKSAAKGWTYLDLADLIRPANLPLSVYIVPIRTYLEPRGLRSGRRLHKREEVGARQEKGVRRGASALSTSDERGIADAQGAIHKPRDGGELVVANGPDGRVHFDSNRCRHNPRYRCAFPASCSFPHVSKGMSSSALTVAPALHLGKPAPHLLRDCDSDSAQGPARLGGGSFALT
ncbi:hypothetical protein CSOJ01_07185 [Colletotrichum sojae]|uniref:Uncharacterized protein n=1 Tax=Colletotrichum sojae TaxID=2175907 RepID=A0A8H6MU04_9PEZI|nr:hypothetical protein CSOJ01_07185 [Colletotrichum sojae]